MAISWSNQVGRHERCKEAHLSQNNVCSEEESWLLEIQENEQVKSLIVCLLQQMMYPPFISYQEPQTP